MDEYTWGGASKTALGFFWKAGWAFVHGWQLVGHKFVMDWKMVWEEILIGFTVAGFVAVVVPTWFWSQIFLIDAARARFPAGSSRSRTRWWRRSSPPPRSSDRWVT